MSRSERQKGKKEVKRRNVRGKVNKIQREKFREKGEEGERVTKQSLRGGGGGGLTVHSRP